ncbi:PREDICTED: DNA replication licensing factor MCM7-like [Erythranthe guttata]|uniref:DNA replication licensing factor MCM7-like n=1 Tax=Erythranthe guttata TaxID=4155 RepID=UPI00064DFEBF|nr:PREDICTED: DNA replication licensing factor MCM7-like [Erythranthe guttata]|eukprot:XP_012857700.1 PREDICTED: DNA replication licensing factor MCM7-like [Erythranthe guttata]
MRYCVMLFRCKLDTCYLVDRGHLIDGSSMMVSPTIYFDYILIYNKNLDDHVVHLKSVLHALREEKVYANLLKCTFCMDKLVTVSKHVKRVHLISSIGMRHSFLGKINFALLCVLYVNYLCLNRMGEIRGDLHVCLMGDPGVAKSQLLKYIISVAPGGVYTTGKISSGVGLTAVVQKDPVTNEMVLEGGALICAIMGICAIDEFDIMDESDRTSIHEVMDQQTVSIAKGCITTSLNARTAILAAANPAWFKYDLWRTPAENINLPPALLSRFDLLWLILDRADMDTDLEMARHVLHVHQMKESPELGFTPLEPSFLRAYISAVRKLSPVVPRELEEYIPSAYSSIRQEEAKSNAPHSYTTVRTLLSILRISAALARLRFSHRRLGGVQSDVDESLWLMQMSKFSLYSDNCHKSGLDAISDIYSMLRHEAARYNMVDVSYAHALNWISRKGYSEAQLKECLEEYAAFNVWRIHPNTFDIRFIDA